MKRWLTHKGKRVGRGFYLSPVLGSVGVGLTPDLPTHPQTALVVEAVKKDQEGDAAAALSLYCKALDFFVPALHCECQAEPCSP